MHLGQALMRWSSPPESPWIQPKSEDLRPYPKARLESEDSADPKTRSSVRGKPLLLVAFVWLSSLPKETSDPPDRVVVSDAERLRPFRNLDSTSRYFSTPCYVALRLARSEPLSGAGDQSIIPSEEGLILSHVHGPRSSLSRFKPSDPDPGRGLAV